MRSGFGVDWNVAVCRNFTASNCNDWPAWAGDVRRRRGQLSCVGPTNGGRTMNDLAQHAAPKDSASGGNSWPPSWQTMPHGIRVGRYIDPEFAKLEYEKLWSKTWQAGARLDEIPEVGDYTVYNIGDQSVVITRADADKIKAYHNVRSEEQTSELQSLMRISYAVFCMEKKQNEQKTQNKKHV